MRTPLVLERLDVEASSRGRADTGYTIQAGHKKEWLAHDLPLSLFTGLLREITHVDVIRFHGWGDPLANPEILPMVAAAKRSGARVELVTDAARLTDEIANALVRDGVDTIVFPLAGIAEATNFRRRGTSLFTVLDAVKRLRAIRSVHQALVPTITTRYTLTRSGLATEMERLPEFLSQAGFETASLRPLSYATAQENEYEVLVPESPEAFDRVRERLVQTIAEAKARGIALHCRLVHGGKTRFSCPDEPGGALFVAADGTVSPCPFRNVPVAGPATYRFHGQILPFLHDVRGNLATKPFAAIWNDPDYQEFRFQHDTNTPPEGCAGCWRSFLTDVR